MVLVGAASADLHMDGYSRCRDLAEIVGICDKDLSRVDGLAARYGLDNYETYDNYDDAIEKCECDVVDICLPNFLHYDVAIKAFRKGRHVISEKPLATRLNMRRKWWKRLKARVKSFIMPRTGYSPQP